MKGQRTKQQNRSAFLTITAVLLMFIVTITGLTAIVSAEEAGQKDLPITPAIFSEVTDLDLVDGKFVKVYDGTDSAELKNTLAIKLEGEEDGIVTGEDVSVEILSAKFNSANVAEACQIDIAYKLTGEDAWRYVDQGTVSLPAKIQPKELENKFTFTVSYNPYGIRLEGEKTDDETGVTVSVNADLGVLDASNTPYAVKNGITTSDSNYVVSQVEVNVDPLVLTVEWKGEDTWSYGEEPIQAYVKDDNNNYYDIFKLVVNPTKADSWAAGNVGMYDIEVQPLDTYESSNFNFVNNSTKRVEIKRKNFTVTMDDYTCIGDGENKYSLSVQVEGDIPEKILREAVKYYSNGVEFNGIIYGEATVEAVLKSTDNYRFVDKEEGEIEKLTATLTVLCKEKVFPVYDEDGNKVGDVILTSDKGFSNDVTAKVTAIKGFPKVVKTKYNQIYNVKITGAEKDQTFTLIIPLSENVFGSRIEKLSLDTLSVYEAGNKTLTPATDSSTGFSVVLGKGFYQVDGFAGDTTFVIAPEYNAPFFQTVWGILLIIVLVIAILVMMAYVGLYLRRVLETREAPAAVIDTIGELPETEPVELEEKEEIDIDAVIEQNLDEIAESVKETAEESIEVDEAALDEAVEEIIESVVAEASEIVLDEEPAEEAVEAVAEEIAETVEEEAPVADEEVVVAAEEVVEEVVETVAEETEAVEEPVAEVVAEEVTEEVAEEVVAETVAEEVVENSETESDDDDDNDDGDESDDGDDAVEAVSMVEDNSSFGFGANVDPSTFVDVKEDPEAYQAMLAREARGEIKIIYRYKKSFQSKLAQSQGNVQDYYSELKNALLTFKGVKNRLSWNYEAFNKGRAHVAKMDAKSKTLYLYLALDPAQFADTKYSVVDVSAKRKYASTPTLMKIKGERKFKHALELIEKLCGEQMELVKVEAEKIDYRVERMTIDEMVDAGLMKQNAGYVVLVPETEPEAIPADAQVETTPEQN